MERMRGSARTTLMAAVAAVAAVAGSLVAAPGTASAQEGAQAGGASATGRAAELEAVVGCRSLTDPALRLACFDAAAARLDAAERSGAVIVADRARIREARRGLFGFTLPKIGLFGGRGGDDGADAVEEVDEIETTISAASQFGYGRWRLKLADGSVWTQADSKDLRQPPKPGTAVRIKRAALGSYLATIGGQPGVRVRREN